MTRAGERAAICAKCEHQRLLPKVNLRQCAACGCLIALKTAVPGARCPKGKWR